MYCVSFPMSTPYDGHVECRVSTSGMQHQQILELDETCPGASGRPSARAENT
jgi:hypothetical protein